MKLNIKTNILIDKSYKNLSEEINFKKFKKIVLIVDKKIYQFNYIKKIVSTLKKEIKVKGIFFFEEPHEPTYEYLDKSVNFFRKNNKSLFDAIIVIGGGSTMDFAKGCAILSKNFKSAINYMGFPKNIKDPIPVITIPSTTSTGSEIIYNAVFTSKKMNKKLGINSEKNFPIITFYDPKIIALAPKEIIIYSALATFNRAIESFVFSKGNFLTKEISRHAFDLVRINLPKYLKTKNLEYLKKLQLAGSLSIIALSNSGGGCSGILNYYFSTNFAIPQAKSFSITALEILKFNINNKFHEYKNILQSKKLLEFKKIVKSMENILLSQKKKKSSLNLSSNLNKVNYDLSNKLDMISSRNNIRIKQADLIKLTKKITRYIDEVR
jgi:alcohol dehydrogenase class IV